jgi:mRNA interferase MazF
MQRGEIYFVQLNPVVGREQANVRPVLVVSVDEINQMPLVVTVVAGTDSARVVQDFRSNVRIPASASGLPAETVFLCFQIRARDHSRFPAQVAGRLSPTWMKEIQKALRYCLGM